jgi:signal transduction histidine kinase
MARFRVRARTVDMLGRQQIAGIPTAISELFKNAHDAYAKNVEVDYFRDDDLFVLRDDGLGMTREDFEQRWLTLGTESKLGSPNLKPPPRDPDQPKRPILGEKGIGRLAIAIIGPQVLVLSRARRDRTPADKLIAAYLHWGLFELPGLDLEDVLIPVREFKGGEIPNSKHINEMVKEVVSTLNRLSARTDERRIKTIRTQIDRFDVDPAGYAEFLREPSLTGNGTGTHFFIRPADPIIKDDIDNRQADNKATRFERNLIGFTNTMTPDHTAPPIVARFRDHKDEGAPQELIGERAFFTPDEFKEVDHHLIGRFDKYGQFRGKVGIYQTKPEDYVLAWSESIGRPTECGPFSLTFAYMQGQARDSLVPPEEHARLRRKLERHGGLYIYRDGIRVQPYGDSDYDWLDIERNRTLSASYYFYSYRRMFGVIELTQHENEQLTEKAGREGFRENVAYRQLRSILMNFFLHTAGDFFREEGKYAESHTERKAELNRNEEIRRKQAGQVRKKRADFHEALTHIFSAIDERKPELDVERAVASTKRETDRVVAQSIPAQQKALALMRVEKQGRDVLHQLRKELAVTRPRVGLSRQLSNEWSSYLSQVELLDAKVFGPSEALIEEYVSSAAKRTKVPLDDAARLNVAVSGFSDEALRSMRQLRTDVATMLTDIATKVRDTARQSFLAVTHTVDNVMAELESLQRSPRNIGQLGSVREKLADEINAVYATERKKLERMRDELSQVGRIWEQDGYDTTELTEAMEEELEELRRRRDADLDLAQIGLALNTISHEFDKTVGSLRDGFRRLKAWADENPELESLYRDLRISFDHLDEYLTLFTPLDRRLHRTEIDIAGKQIFQFLENLFGARLKRHDVSLIGTRKFMQASVHSYPSSIYSAFVNLVDNSIFWLQRRQSGRQITLDAQGADLIVRDNGPGVSARDRENIFALNFSRKPGGRGMGLHISRETLAKAGFLLTLDQENSDAGAVFRISPQQGRHAAQGDGNVTE